MIGIDHFFQIGRTARGFAGLATDLRSRLDLLAFGEIFQNLRGDVVIQIFVIIVVDLDHRRVGAIAHALDFGQREQAVRRRLALGHALVLARRHHVITAAQHAGRGAANLHMIASDRREIVHGVEGRNFVGAHIRHVEIGSDIFDHRNRQPALADTDTVEDVAADTGADTVDDVASDTATDTATDVATDASEDTAEDVPPPCEAALIHGEGEPLVQVNECGTLTYGLYAAQGESNAVHRLPDWSWAGYRRGGVALPDVPAVRTVAPGDGDDRARIQAAIDEVSALPLDGDHRGAVVLDAGTYQLDDSLQISASGVVLRGAGQGADGTVLVATRRAQHSVIRVQGSGSGFGEVDDTRTDIVSTYVPVGARSFDVASTAPFSIGDTVGVVRTPNDAWITALGMAPFGWTASGYTVTHERVITAIDGDTITVDIPLVDAITDTYGGGELFVADMSSRIAEVGVEDLRIVSEYDGDDDENHAWNAVELRRATDSWVRRVTVVHLGYAAVSFTAQASFNTVEEVAYLDPVSQVTGGRRYAFNVSGGIGNLFQRCYSSQARHDFVTGSRVTGPNVWLDCYSHASSNDDGPHHRWATGMLLDNVVSRFQHVENREDSGTGHGWSGAQTLFFNTLAEGIRCDAPTGSMNWVIGSVGAQQEGGWNPSEPFGWWESHGTPVEPRSLYLAQLHDRLGASAVEAITTPHQREGRIWTQLRNWAGDGLLADADTTGGLPCADGILSGDICCAASCGSCGGTGCGSRPGGASSCCTGSIRDSGRSCDAYEPPCVVTP